MRIKVIKGCTLGGVTYTPDANPIEVDDEIGKALTTSGYAEDAGSRPGTAETTATGATDPKTGDHIGKANRQHGAPDAEAIAKAEEEPMMRVRFRRQYSVRGRSHTAGTVDLIPADDEGWEAVNTGACDLDPPPGVNGQPFPPEFVRSSPETEAPIPLQTVQGRQDIQAVPARGQQGKPGEATRQAGGTQPSGGKPNAARRPSQ